MLRTALTDLLGLDVPVIGAPMAGVSGGRLAAAVTAGGGDPGRDAGGRRGRREDYDTAVIYAGQGVGLVTAERSATTVVAELGAGAERLLRRWA